MRTRADMEYEIPINFGEIAGQFRPAAAAWGGEMLLLPCRSVGWDLATIGTPAAMRVFMTSPLPTQGEYNYYVRILTRASCPSLPLCTPSNLPLRCEDPLGTPPARQPASPPARQPASPPAHQPATFPVPLQAATGQRIRWCGG